MSHATISKALSGQVKVTFDFCAAIAKAFGEPPEKVFRLAGLLASLPDPTEEEEHTLKEIWGVVQELSVQERREVYNYAKYRLDKEQEEGRHKPPSESEEK